MDSVLPGGPTELFLVPTTAGVTEAAECTILCVAYYCGYSGVLSVICVVLKGATSDAKMVISAKTISIIILIIKVIPSTIG